MVGETVANAAPTWYIRGMSLLWSKNSAGVTSYLYNAHGDVVKTTGAAENDYLYDAFGNQVDEVSNQPFDWRVEVAPVVVDDNPFRYCGEYFDYETGYIYLRARYYDSSNGRFISEDPIRSGNHWYAYCGGNPIKFVDPMGLKFTPPGQDPNDPKHNDGSVDAKYGSYTPPAPTTPPAGGNKGQEKDADKGGEKGKQAGYDNNKEMDKLKDKPAQKKPKVDTVATAPNFSDMLDMFDDIMRRIFGIQGMVTHQDEYGELLRSWISWLITVKEGTRTTITTGDLNSFLTFYARERTDDPFMSSVGAKLNIYILTLNLSLGLDDIGLSGSVKSGNTSQALGISVNIAQLKVGFEYSSTYYSGNASETNYINCSVSGMGLLAVAGLIFTGQWLGNPAPQPAYAR